MSLYSFSSAAFLSYPVSREVYADYVASVVRRESIENQQSDETQQSKKENDVSTVEAGKPHSVSGDVLDLSQDAQKLYEAKDKDTDDSIKLDAEVEDSSKTSAASQSGVGETELTPEEQDQVQELKARDQEVRTHEAAHVSVGGPYVTSGPSYTYQTGPDGKQYAIGGEVGIDTSEISGDPEATIQKMQTVAAAATAPAEPSGQDMKVAAAAHQKEAQARVELAKQKSNDESQNAEFSPSVAKSESESSPADQTVADSDSSSTVKSFVAGVSQSSRQSSAYQAQSAMPLSSKPQSVFSAFA